MAAKKPKSVRRHLDAPAAARFHRDHPPVGTADDQTTAFTEVLKRLYKLEDGMWPDGTSTAAKLYCEARAICERHLPVQLVATLRKRHG